MKFEFDIEDWGKFLAENLEDVANDDNRKVIEPYEIWDDIHEIINNCECALFDEVWEDDTFSKLKDDVNTIEIVEEIESIFREANL